MMMMSKYLTIFSLFLLTFSGDVTCYKENHQLLVVTVATHPTDGFQRFNRSVNVYGLQLHVLGLDQPWTGGDVARRPGGGQKIRLLREYFDQLSNELDIDDRLILFTDSYDVILNGNDDQIVKVFNTFNADVVFSSEKFCWPDKSLAKLYPTSDGGRYLNSGGFIGRFGPLYEILKLSEHKINDNDDDQLFYTEIYLNSNYRQKYRIKLDTKSKLFQNLNGETDNIELRFSPQNSAATADKSMLEAFIINKQFQTRPLIVHGNGQSKILLNSLGNYLARSWHPAVGCLACNETSNDRFEFDDQQQRLPHVLMAITVLKPTPFFREFLQYLTELNYPKNRITVLIQSKVNDYHTEEIDRFIQRYQNYYKQIKSVGHQSNKKEWQIRNNYLDECVRINCDYLFVVDSDVRLTNPRTLRDLIVANRSIIAPMLVRPKEYWSNFWGTITDDGYYSRSHDYVQIIQNERRGIWNVPYISSCYLLKSSLLNDHGEDDGHTLMDAEYWTPLSYLDRHSRHKNNQEDDDDDPELVFCRILRSNNVFMFVTNVDDYGHLAQLEMFDTSLKHPDFYEIYTNEIEWRKRYIHPNYSRQLLPETTIEQPCPDVYWFPVVTEEYCKHLIEIMENFGEWSAGKNNDPRLAGGYENVPTVDIHMNQVGLEQHWLYFLREYIRPIQEKVFIGYYHDPPKAIMNFVVRYHPNEQAFLRPHHDSSTYTVNIALNRAGIDYEGGGCRFVRQNCSLTNLRQGWSLIHPGRLTHYHEGLTVTKGVRYIMVSFVDP